MRYLAHRIGSRGLAGQEDLDARRQAVALQVQLDEVGHVDQDFAHAAHRRTPLECAGTGLQRTVHR